MSETLLNRLSLWWLLGWPMVLHLSHECPLLGKCHGNSPEAVNGHVGMVRQVVTDVPQWANHPLGIATPSFSNPEWLTSHPWPLGGVVQWYALAEVEPALTGIAEIDAQRREQFTTVCQGWEERDERMVQLPREGRSR